MLGRLLGSLPNLLQAHFNQYFAGLLVPKKGLEPPHPCEYVDLNHARLPIPPLRHARPLRHVALSRQQF
jgi:hypothetical protein